ncbi:Uncharacterised protein [uncultured archaeon]|nr:Uncharacterised protein [uncultured archaeon]
MNAVLNSSNVQCPKPEVGMGATKLYFTDRAAYTIVRVSPSGKTFWMKRDKATRTDTNGMSESQTYSYESLPDIMPEEAVRLCQDGQWRSVGMKVLVSARREYHDYSF